jgi:hypothetical protein
MGQQPMGGLLAPSSNQFPGPLPPIPGLVPDGMRPTGMRLGSEQVLAYLLRQEQPEVPDDADDDLPAALRPFAAGLRPAAKPEGIAWQQEIIYERVGKNDEQIAAVARHYFRARRTTTRI